MIAELLQLDWVQVALGIIVVCIFLAIFTLLRTMNSPFIKRFENILRTPLQDLEHPEGSKKMTFKYDGKIFDILEIKYEKFQEDRTVYNKYVFLRVSVENFFNLRFRNITQSKVGDKKLSSIIGAAIAAPLTKLEAVEIPEFYKDMEVWTDDKLRAQRTLSDDQVVQCLSKLKVQSGAYGLFNIIPLIFTKQCIILDYRQSEKFVNQLIHNPRLIKNHILYLNELANATQKIQS